ncbi:hypothetical protein FGO68_gene7766 [Halteria grandinella]|uniref:Casein kinase I n=1 Tax=Halteria grandinella TaxID=5974 RepID=A0A8J8T2U7_HALGN|nr:hypothetical protein FGO68_gene7766 [Halteria grandinella]
MAASVMEEVKDEQLTARHQQIQKDKEFIQGFSKAPKIIGSAHFRDIHCFLFSNPKHSLKDYITSYCGKKDRLSRQQLCLQLFEAIKELHEQGLLHQNITDSIFRVTEGNKVKLVDFGSGKQYVRPSISGKLSEPQDESTESLKSQAPYSRRDDLLAFCFLLMKLFSYNPLPWSSQAVLDKQLSTNSLKNLKGANSISLKSLLSFYKEVYQLSAEQDPNYASLANKCEQNDINYNPLVEEKNFKAINEVGDQLLREVEKAVLWEYFKEIKDLREAMCAKCILKDQQRLLFVQREAEQYKQAEIRHEEMENKFKKLKETSERYKIQIVMAGEDLPEQGAPDVHAMDFNQLQQFARGNINLLTQLHKKVKDQETITKKQDLQIQFSEVKLQSLTDEIASKEGVLADLKLRLAKFNEQNQAIQDLNPTIAELQQSVRRLQDTKGSLTESNITDQKKLEEQVVQIEQNDERLKEQRNELFSNDQELNQSTFFKVSGYITLILMFVFGIHSLHLMATTPL